MFQVKTTDKAIRRNLLKQIDQIFWSVEIQLLILFFLSELLRFNELLEFNEHFNNNKQSRCWRVNMISDESQEKMSQSLFMHD